MDATKERAIAERARTQLGLVTLDDLAIIGVSPPTIRRRVASGAWQRLGARTLLAAPISIDDRTRVLAACLDLGAVASHRTAAWLHQLIAHPGLIEVTVLKGTVTPPVGRPEGLIVHTTTALPPDDVVTVGAIPTTSVARTMLGLAALDPSFSDAALVDVVEDAVRRRLASDRWLWWLLEERRCRGRNGVRRLEQVLAERSSLGPTESWLERALLQLIDDAGLPRPEVQRRITRRGAFVARVDLAYGAGTIVIEALGYRHHATREQQSRDAERASRLQLQGCEVHQFTYDQIVRTPEVVAEIIAHALTRAGLLRAA